MTNLTVELTSEACCAVVRLDGDVDLASVDQLRAVTVEASELAPVRHLILDCRELDFLDSSGLKALIEANDAFDGALVLVSPKRAVRRVLEITGLDGSFASAESIEEARHVLHRE
ncbi:MAG TPA: STAS domain-containing protein [Acidimicrobiia bacterium]|nr:STAS domain-containing protein [Acidimicrobiia bacterium]